MADGVSSDWTDMIDLENRTLEMEGVFEHKSTFSFDKLQTGCWMAGERKMITANHG